MIMDRSRATRQRLALAECVRPLASAARQDAERYQQSPGAREKGKKKMTRTQQTAEKKRIAILTDSACDVPQDLLDEYGITTVPVYVLWGDEQLRDGVDIDNETFYARLPEDPAHPTTSQPTPADFVKAIEALDAEEAVILTISGGLSGTYASASSAAQQVSMPVHVFDSLSVSMGLGWQVLAAARMRDAGGDAQAIMDAARAAREKMSLLFTCDTLEYLHRGGRIGGAAKLLGTLLQLKPMLGVDHSTGLVDAVERTRTRKKALSRIVEATLERVDVEGSLHVGIIHGGARGDAELLAERIQTQCTPTELLYAALSPALGAHTGPGVVGICAYSD